MKVSTDACIQGAWTPLMPEVRTALDIGAGTGLLSLMLAQRRPSMQITALEIDVAAAKQASENFRLSFARDRIRTVETDARHFNAPEPFDLIVCNPPFFINSLKGGQANRNIARHDIFLSLDELAEIIVRSLKPMGYASILLPVREHEQWQIVARKHGLHIFQTLGIVPRFGLTANRIVSLCAGTQIRERLSEELVIRNPDHSHTPEFSELLRPYYLDI